MRRGLPSRCPAPRLLACFASSSENYTSRKTAISPLHPAISTRRRGRGAGRFYTRSKRPATPRGECDFFCAADPPGTRMRWSVRGMHARRRGSASGRRARVRRRRGAHIMWCLAMQRRRQQNRFSARFSERRTRANFPPKKISTISIFYSNRMNKPSPPRPPPSPMHAGWMVSATKTPTSSAPSQDRPF
jgi:hypothetical protein